MWKRQRAAAALSTTLRQQALSDGDAGNDFQLPDAKRHEKAIKSAFILLGYHTQSSIIHSSITGGWRWWGVSHVHYSQCRMCKLCMCPSKRWLACVIDPDLDVATGLRTVLDRTLLFWLSKCLWDMLVLQTAMRTLGPRLSSSGMQPDQLFLNHMTPCYFTPPQVLHCSSPWYCLPRHNHGKERWMVMIRQVTYVVPDLMIISLEAEASSFWLLRGKCS